MKKKPKHSPPLPLAPRYVDEVVAANYLGVARKSLQNWRLRGIGPRFVRLEGSIRYAIDELTAYAEARRAQSLAEADRHDDERRKAAEAEEAGHG
jgi:hypothetical protein